MLQKQREDHRMGDTEVTWRESQQSFHFPGICASCSFVGMMTDRFFTPMAGISPFKIWSGKIRGTLERNSARKFSGAEEKDQGNTLLFEIVNAKLQAGKNVGFPECR